MVCIVDFKDFTTLVDIFNLKLSKGAKIRIDTRLVHGMSRSQIIVYIYSSKVQLTYTCNMHMKSKCPSSITFANQKRVKCVTV